MIPYSYKFVDFKGTDLSAINGLTVDGIYNDIVTALNRCGEVVLYNWFFASIPIAPSYCSIDMKAGYLTINDIIEIREDDTVWVESLIPDPPTLVPLSVSENGQFSPLDYDADGFSDVEVEVLPNIQPATFSENGTYQAPEGVDGFNPVVVEVSGGLPDNDLLFHFDDFKNSGKMNAAFYNKTGYVISDEQSKFGGTSLKVASAPAPGGAVYFENGFTLGNQDFTLDFWFYPTSVPSSVCIISFNYRSLGLYMNSFKYMGPNFASSPDSWAVSRPITLGESLANSWHHWALVRSGNEFYFFIDGVKLDTFEWSGSFATMTRMSFGTNSINITDWRGYVDELRLRLGLAVWTSDFTPPTEPYS